MEYDIDFLPVGNGEKSGDAIVLRCFDSSGQFVMVIDGGTKESGEKLVNHIKHYYKTDQVNLVVSTHPDADHSSGLTEVLENLRVDRLWMHQPWNHAEDINNDFENGRVLGKTIKASLRKSLENVCELERIALRKKIPIQEPFSDHNLGISGINVLGPSVDFYESLLPQFREFPEPKPSPGGLRQAILTATSTIVEKATHVAETWGIETLSDPNDDATSAENNSSVIIHVTMNGKGFLFTGDSGVPALNPAMDHASGLGINISNNLEFIQVPHHGSRRNVGPTLLNRVLGPNLMTETNSKTAYISVAPDSDKHPSKKVVNAFKRRGARVYSTKGIHLYHHSSGSPDRGWGSATPLPFYSQVESD